MHKTLVLFVAFWSKKDDFSRVLKIFISRRIEKVQNLKKMATLTFKSLINRITKKIPKICKL
jgi:hypothetical protein